jgi:hypothetical protein
MQEIIHAAAANWFWTVIGVIIVVSIISSKIASMANARSRERSRREIAAYIAEGSMSAEQGERLMSAGGNPDSCC